jgi:hypothetical protein
MWPELVRELARFPDGVLTGRDTDGYPVSVRCRPRPDHVHRLLRCRRPCGIELVDGRASLLCHSHDERLWALRSFLIRGELSTGSGEWIFTPLVLVPGQGLAGPVGDLRSFVAARRRAGRYLGRRRLARPQVPWSRLRARDVPDRSTNTD